MTRSYEPFYERFKEVAMKETRRISIHNNLKLPDDDYGFLEAYYNDESFDCWQVFINVTSCRCIAVVAVSAYGWEGSAFYARGYRQNDLEISECPKYSDLHVCS